jgi:hypothetical protein
MPLHALGSALPMSRRGFVTAIAAVTGTAIAAPSAHSHSNKKVPSEMTRKAFVYTEVQVAVPFEQAQWQDRNPVLHAQEGLLSKIWLSGHNTKTLGGLDAFDTLEKATKFAVNDFPKMAASMNAAFYARIFDARVTEAASRALNSPYYL